MQSSGLITRIASQPAMAFAASSTRLSNVGSTCWKNSWLSTAPAGAAALRVPGGYFHAFAWSSQPYQVQHSGPGAQGYHVSCGAFSGEAPQAEEEEFEPPEALTVPAAWASPEVAAQESEWLRGALHQWLDDEYCPEPANEEISKRCASVFHYCLLEKQLDIGDILMQMVNNLETFSFKESFHGSFSSANAAVALITKRMSEAS